jgi:hypothetical protein
MSADLVRQSSRSHRRAVDDRTFFELQSHVSLSSWMFVAVVCVHTRRAMVQKTLRLQPKPSVNLFAVSWKLYAELVSVSHLRSMTPQVEKDSCLEVWLPGRQRMIIRTKISRPNTHLGRTINLPRRDACGKTTPLCIKMVEALPYCME